MLKTFPDDDKIREWRMRAAKESGNETGAPARWGRGIGVIRVPSSDPIPLLNRLAKQTHFSPISCDLVSWRAYGRERTIPFVDANIELSSLWDMGISVLFNLSGDS